MKKWYVVKTKGNKENFAKQNLINQNFEVYYPVTKRLKKVANKLKVVEQSLFPGYLFVKFDLNTYDWSKINNTRGVSSLIKLSQNLMHIPEVDIHNLKLAEDDENFVSISMIQLPTLGRLYKILQGPFKGCEAKYNGKKDKKNIFLLLNVFGRDVNLNLPSNCIEPV